jgi:hypothetical protein
MAQQIEVLDVKGTDSSKATIAVPGLATLGAAHSRDEDAIKNVTAFEAVNLGSREILRALDRLAGVHRALLNPSLRREFQLSGQDLCWTNDAVYLAANEDNEELRRTWNDVLFLCALLKDRGQLQLASPEEVMLGQLGGSQHYEDDKPAGYPSWFVDHWEDYADACAAEVGLRREALRRS